MSFRTKHMVQESESAAQSTSQNSMESCNGIDALVADTILIRDLSQIITIKTIMDKDQKYQRYWELQLSTLLLLKRLKINLPLNYRIDPMRILWRMRKERRKDGFVEELIGDIENSISELVKLRIEGFEPPHKGNRYT